MNKGGGKFLKAINPANWIKGAVKETGQQVTNVVDEATYSQEESAQESTKRHKADMESDNRWSQSVRPTAFYYFLLLFTILIAFDIDIDAWQKEMIQTCFLMILGWYFGERAIRHIIKEVRKPTDRASR